jgi:hypothetical protein
MRGNYKKQLPGPLQRARVQFERWRQVRQRGAPIPERLWRLATELAAQHGVCQTAGVLKLDYYSLKRRLSESTSLSPAETDRPRFVELPQAAPTAAGECLIECENATGARLRMHLKGVALSDLAALGRSLWRAE